MLEEIPPPLRANPTSDFTGNAPSLKAYPTSENSDEVSDFTGEAPGMEPKSKSDFTDIPQVREQALLCRRVFGEKRWTERGNHEEIYPRAGKAGYARRQIDYQRRQRPFQG